MFGVYPPAHLYGQLRDLGRSRDDCKWTQVPRALASLEKDFGRLGRQSPDVRGSEFFARNDCGSLAEFRRDYEGVRDRSP